MPARPSEDGKHRRDRLLPAVRLRDGSVAATGSSQVVIGSQYGANWIQPPMVASTVSTATGTSIVQAGPPCLHGDA